MNKQKNLQKPNKLVSWILGLLVVVAVLVWVAVAQAPDKNLHLYFLNVGQGDSIYVRTMNNFDLLIDGGSDSKVLSELGKVMPFYDRKIDLVVLTHPHSDHLSGLINVLGRYEVGEVLATDATHTSSEYLQWLNLIKEKNIPYKLARAGESINLDEKTALDILWPKESYLNQGADNLNNTSVVAKLTYNNFSALFTGDAEIEVQQKLLDSIIRVDQRSNPLESAIMKVPHHGSSNGADLDFFKAVNPAVAIISVGENNQFGHPHASTLDKLTSLGAQIFRTDKNGTVEIISNGQTYQVKTEK